LKEGDIGYQLLMLRLKVVSCFVSIKKKKKKVVSCFACGVNRKMEVSMHANLRGCVNHSGWYLLCIISVEFLKVEVGVYNRKKLMLTVSLCHRLEVLKNLYIFFNRRYFLVQGMDWYTGMVIL